MEVYPGIHRIPISMGDNPLRHVNSYLMEGDDGWTLVDCGYSIPESLRSLQSQLHELGVRLEDIRTLIVTHFHGDHYGQAGTLHRLGARLLMSRVDWEYIRTHLADAEAAKREMAAWLERNGLSLEGRSEEDRRVMESGSRFDLIAPDRPLDDGDRIQVGRHTLRVVSTPGHSPGHICLYDAERGLFFSGDHLLDPITPHVSTSRPLQGDQFSKCVESLHKVAKLEAELILPGHAEPFAGLARRVGEVLARHHRREREILEILTRGPATGAGIAAGIPWTRHRYTLEQLSARRQRVVVGQVVAHLEKLRAEGRVARLQNNGRVYYRRMGPGS